MSAPAVSTPCFTYSLWINTSESCNLYYIYKMYICTPVHVFLAVEIVCEFAITFEGLVAISGCVRFNKRQS